MARRIMMFRAEHGGNLEHPFVHAHQRLLVKLGRLRKIHLLSEIVQFEHVRAAFRAREIDLRRMHFREIPAR